MVMSVLENEEGLYHLGTSIQKWSGDLGPREWRGIVSSWDICPKRIQWLRSLRMWRDCIILELLFKMYMETSVPKNVVGLHHPWTSVQNVSGGFSPYECGGIASSLNLGSKCIWRLRPPWMWWDCIIPKPQFKMYSEVLAPMNVVGLHHPWTSVQNVSRSFGHHECGRISSSLELVLKWKGLIIP